MRTYFALFLIAAGSSLMITPLLRRGCARFWLGDEPRDDRRVHQKPVPRLGGVAIYLSILIPLSVLSLVNNLVSRGLRPQLKEIVVLLGCGLLVLLLGVYDDLRGANAALKFAALAAVTTLFYALGGRIGGLSIPFIGGITIHPVLGFVLTMIWVVGIANAFNLIDGIDGLASGSALFSSLVLLTVSLIQGNAMLTAMALVLTGALAGFLRYNFNPASIFLGDSGSLFIGFTLAALSVQGSQKASTAVAVAIPILACGLPVVDAGVTIARRFVSGKPIFQGDREHIHHMLLARGWSQRRVALVLYGVCATFGLLALMFPATGSKLPGFMLFVVSVAVIVAVGHLRYHEVEEIRAGVKRTVGDRRLRVANNIRVRRAALAVSKASDLYEMFEAAKHMLDFGEFTFANAQVGQAGRAELNERAFEASLQRHPKQLLEFRHGRVYWSWSRVVADSEDTSNTRGQWSFRLPLVKDGVEWGWLNLYRNVSGETLLVETNYLSDLFRREFTEAAARIFSAHEVSEVVHEMPESAPAMAMQMAAKG